MRITIAEKLRPFSHHSGTSFVLPGSSQGLKIYPSYIQVVDLSVSSPRVLAEFYLDIEGPVKDFTVIQDLEKGCLNVFGNSIKGYFRYRIHAIANTDGMIVIVEKAPEAGIVFEIAKEKKVLKAGERAIFTGSQHNDDHKKIYSAQSSERLSLGSHKSQDWELVRRRLSFADIFPIWFRIGQLVPMFDSTQLIGTAQLLNDCKDAISANAPEKILEYFERVFLTAFDGVLSPRLIDTDFQGIKYRGQDLSLLPAVEGSPLAILTEGARLIRSLFVQENNKQISILPAIPPEFHCGRFLDIKCGERGELCLEWTKKSIRRMTYLAKENQTLSFVFANHEKACRLRTSFKDPGSVYTPGTLIDLLAGNSYWFDNFQR
jgi:hypothetical protein